MSKKKLRKLLLLLLLKNHCEAKLRFYLYVNEQRVYIKIGDLLQGSNP